MIPYIRLNVPIPHTSEVLVAFRVRRPQIFHDPPPVDVKFWNIVLLDDFLPLSFREKGVTRFIVDDANQSPS